MITQSVGLLLEYDGKVVLQLRDNDPSIFFPGYWSIFTGKVKNSDRKRGPYTRFESAILREISEELGVKKDGKVIDFVPNGLKLFYKGFYEDETQKCQQHVFSSVLHVPFEELVLREGQAMGLFGSEQISSMDIGANYKGIIESYFEKK